MDAYLYRLLIVMDNNPLVNLGFLLLFGYMGGRVARYFGFPRVSGYIVTGMLLSPSVSGFLDKAMVEDDLSIVIHIVLAFVAFSIAGSLDLKKLKRFYGPILLINLAEAFGSFFFVTVLILLVAPLFVGPAVSFWQGLFPMALIIGAVSAATAPAAVLAIVHEYRARGPLTTVLLGVVALDDAIAIVFYTIAISVAQSLISLEVVSWRDVVVAPLAAISLSVLIGIVPGIIMRKAVRFIENPQVMLGVLVGFIFLASGVATGLGASPLIANMVFGFVVRNYVKSSLDLFGLFEGMEVMLFSVFFTLAGAHLDIQVMMSTGSLLACLIVFGRFTGKFYGVHVGSRISRAPEVVRRYLGLALLPKAGVTVGLILLAKNVFNSSPLADLMVNAVLGSVIINELIAPLLVRYALFKAGEAQVVEHR